MAQFTTKKENVDVERQKMFYHAVMEKKTLWQPNLLDPTCDLNQIQQWINIGEENKKHYSRFFDYFWAWKPEKKCNPSNPNTDYGIPKDATIMKQYMEKGRYRHFTEVTTVDGVIKVMTNGEFNTHADFLKKYDESIKTRFD